MDSAHYEIRLAGIAQHIELMQTQLTKARQVQEYVGHTSAREAAGKLVSAIEDVISELDHQTVVNHNLLRQALRDEGKLSE